MKNKIVYKRRVTAFRRENEDAEDSDSNDSSHRYKQDNNPFFIIVEFNLKKKELTMRNHVWG